MDRIVVLSPGQPAEMKLPGAFGVKVILDAVVICRDAEPRYRVEWWDAGPRSATVSADDLIAEQTSIVSLETFRDRNERK